MASANRRSYRRTLLRGVVHHLMIGGVQEANDTRCGASYRNDPGHGVMLAPSRSGLSFNPSPPLLPDRDEKRPPGCPGGRFCVAVGSP